MNAELSETDLAALRALDTPTVCNAIEKLAGHRTGIGFTTQPLVCSSPDLPPMVGYARTATIRAAQPSGRNEREELNVNLAYYRHMAQAPNPTISVIEDIDPTPGYGAWWGEVHTNMHKGLGSLGTITNGSIRDLPQCAQGFQMLAGSVGPSHAFVYCVEVGIPVTVAGMRVHPGDLIHADRHGAVVLPADIARAISETATRLAREEAILIDASRREDFGWETLERLLMRSLSH